VDFDLAVLDDPDTTTSADGTPVAVYDLGGKGPDALLVHATGFCAGTWLPLVGRLEGLHITALDIRGHGQSGGGDSMDWVATGDDVTAAIDALGLDRPFGIGHSMGGASLLLAEIARPDTFSGLWLFEPIVFPADFPSPPPGAPNPMVDAARRRRADFPSADAALANFSSKPPLSVLHPEALAAYVRHGFAASPDGGVTLRCQPEFEASTYAAGTSPHTWQHLDEVRCPVTVVCGRPEPGPPMLAPGVAERLPFGRLETHPEVGHFAPLSDLEQMADSVTAAVRALD